MEKSCFVLEILHILYILNHSIKFKNYDVIKSNSTRGRRHFSIYLLNCTSMVCRETWPTTRYGCGQYFRNILDDLEDSKSRTCLIYNPTAINRKSIIMSWANLKKFTSQKKSPPGGR